MLKVKIEHNNPEALDIIAKVNLNSIKSKHYYKGYLNWYNDKFVPSYLDGNASIITTHCKTYDTLLGFSLVKHEEEVKISNLSPLIDGVGVTQCLLDGIEFVLVKDYDIYIPEQAIDLLYKVKTLGFHHVETGLSKDSTLQHKFTKPRNISWI